jgi:hypothetical protein
MHIKNSKFVHAKITCHIYSTIFKYPVVGLAKNDKLCVRSKKIACAQSVKSPAIALRFVTNCLIVSKIIQVIDNWNQRFDSCQYMDVSEDGKTLLGCWSVERQDSFSTECSRVLSFNVTIDRNIARLFFPIYCMISSNRLGRTHSFWMKIPNYYMTQMVVTLATHLGSFILLIYLIYAHFLVNFIQ